MNELSRRSLLAGCAATIALARPVRSADRATEQRLRAVLDNASQDRAAALAQLSGFDPTALPMPLRLDLLTAQAGLRIDVELAARFPFGRAGRSPYLVTPNSGAWAKADAPAETVRRRLNALIEANILAEREDGLILRADNPLGIGARRDLWRFHARQFGRLLRELRLRGVTFDRPR